MPQYIINESTGDLLPFDANMFPVLQKAGWRMATADETPSGNTTGYMVATNGEIAVYSDFIMRQNPNFWRPARKDEVESFLAKMKPCSVAPPAPTAEVNTSRLVLLNGTDITDWKATQVRDYAEKNFDPAPAWAGNMSTEALRQALVTLDREAVAGA
jgi:hypothetical protein